MNSKQYSIYFLTLISSFLFFMIPINNAQVNSDYGYGPETDYYIVMIIPLVFAALSFFGTIYIFYRMFIRWRRSRKHIPLSFKFPFYIAITDFLYSSSILIEFSYAASNKSEFVNNNETITWPFLFCEFFGFLIVFFVLLNIILVGAISIITWLRVVREYYFELGKYDYKIWLPIIFVSLIIPLSSVNSYGSRNYSCGTKIGQDFIGFVVFVLIIVTLTTIVFCYVHVIKTIRDISGHIPNSHVHSEQRSNSVERRTLKKVLTYILVFILQYIPILIYNICMFLKIRHMILDAFSPAVISLGGIGNVMQYLRNEGFKFTASSNNSSNYKLEADEKQSDDTMMNN